jgi:purine-nucleoside phosphorylase
VSGTYVRDLEQAVERYRALRWPEPRALVVSGSGLAVDLDGEKLGKTGLQDLLPFPVHSVIGHPHAVELIQPKGSGPILYQRGRLHSYQGYDAHQTVLVVRLAARLGATTLVMTNAAGGLRAGQQPGDLLLIRDHLNLSGLNPLRGEPPAEWGPRFPDLTAAYDPGLRRLATTTAERLGIELRDGIYAGLAGPSYETPAEVRMLQAMGADLAGMSTVLEVIAARHMGMRCLCFSLVSNPAAGVAEGPVHHEEVLEAGRAAAGKVKGLLDALLRDPALTSEF